MAAVTLIVTALAVAAHRGPGMSALMGAAVLAGQLFVGWTNDLLDADRDKRALRPDKPLALGYVPAARVRRAAAAAALATIPLSLATGLGSGAAHLTAVAAATAYNLGVKHTPLSVLPYAVAFGLVPTFVTAGPPITHAPPAWATAAAALLGAGAHFTQTLTGLDGLPRLLGVRGTSVAGPALMAVAAAVLAFGPPHLYVALGAALVLTAVIAGAAATNHPQLAFRLSLVTAALVTVAVVAAGVRF